jgi:hypothetical protein
VRLVRRDVSKYFARSTNGIGSESKEFVHF